ncbi:MAG TPA: hypothetical protein VF335_08665 [Chitinivibrionales bacterium]
MDGLNLQASVSNVVQMDRHQQDIHRTPGINQEQNAEIARNVSAQRIAKPVEPDDVEKKKVDQGARKNDAESRKKKRSKKQANAVAGKSPESGYFLDVQA